MRMPARYIIFTIRKIPSRAFFRAPGVEVVVVQLRIRRVLRGEAERLSHQFVAVADALHPLGVAVAAVLVDDLVDHVPGMHLADVAPGNCLDARAHAFNLRVAAVGLALRVDEEPSGVWLCQTRVWPTTNMPWRRP